mmetsp:Transcript_22446/g.32741  ORF Transcript_22446/g.32741 Transcript_22446/m.32741 type:complete len:81 (+) Transcript_22446:834-1076(+)
MSREHSLSQSKYQFQAILLLEHTREKYISLLTLNLPSVPMLCSSYSIVAVMGPLWVVRYGISLVDCIIDMEMIGNDKQRI